jgi:hypothetical protein
MKSVLCSHRTEKLWTLACESECIENGPLRVLPENTLGKIVERMGRRTLRSQVQYLWVWRIPPAGRLVGIDWSASVAQPAALQLLRERTLRNRACSVLLQHHAIMKDAEKHVCIMVAE